MGLKKLVFASMMAIAASAAAQEAPDYYPDNYPDIIQASKKEKGVMIYSNMPDNNWAPVIKGFQAKYPWLKVETVDLGSGTVHTRWEAENGSNVRSADLLVSGANDRWAAYGK